MAENFNESVENESIENEMQSFEADMGIEPQSMQIAPMAAAIALPADLPENWTANQIVSHDGVSAGLTPKHGYNYLMKQVNDTQKAVNTLDESKASLASPTFTGTPTAPTAPQPSATAGYVNTTQLATTAFVQNTLNRFQSDLYYTVNIADLQSTIDSLPKYLNRIVTINVNPGTYNDAINISRFSGSGVLNIHGATSATNTHNVLRFSISYNTAVRIYVRGFNATATNGTTFLSARNSCQAVYYHLCRAVAGSSTTANFYGFEITETALGFGSDLEISNKSIAVYSNLSRTSMGGTSGSNNSVAFSAYRGVIHKSGSNPIAATTLHSHASGIIVNPSGGIIGT